MAPRINRSLERELYPPVKDYLESVFRVKFGNCFLEVTANGRFSDALKSTIRSDIIFSFLGRQASPDLVGFVESGSGLRDFITVEVKRGKVNLDDVYQAKKYADLFQARYGLLVSLDPVPEEMKRLHQACHVLYRFMSGFRIYVGRFDEAKHDIAEGSWFPEPPV